MKIVHRILLLLSIMLVSGGIFMSAFGQELNHMHGMYHSSTTTSQNVFLNMMDTMMTAMDAAPLDDSVEGNFLRQMIPHHVGAIEMAKYEIAHGKNPEMLQLAKSILAEQQGEVDEMHTMLHLYPFKSNAHPTELYNTAMNETMKTMMATTPTNTQLAGKDVDCAFALVMLPHHKAAVDMASAVLRFNLQQQIATYALRIISDQQIEIEQMTNFINNHCK